MLFWIGPELCCCYVVLWYKPSLSSCRLRAYCRSANPRSWRRRHCVWSSSPGRRILSHAHSSGQATVLIQRACFLWSHWEWAWHTQVSGIPAKRFHFQTQGAMAISLCPLWPPFASMKFHLMVMCMGSSVVTLPSSHGTVLYPVIQWKSLQFCNFIFNMLFLSGRELWKVSDGCGENGWGSPKKVLWRSGANGAEICCEW